MRKIFLKIDLCKTVVTTNQQSEQFSNSSLNNFLRETKCSNCTYFRLAGFNYCRRFQLWLSQQMSKKIS